MLPSGAFGGGTEGVSGLPDVTPGREWAERFQGRRQAEIWLGSAAGLVPVAIGVQAGCQLIGGTPTSPNVEESTPGFHSIYNCGPSIMRITISLLRTLQKLLVAVYIHT